MSQPHYCSINGGHPLLLGHALPTDVDGNVTPRNSVWGLQTQARVLAQNRTHITDHGQVSQLKGLPLISPPIERFTKKFLKPWIHVTWTLGHKTWQFAATCIHSFWVTEINIELVLFLWPRVLFFHCKIFHIQKFYNKFLRNAIISIWRKWKSHL